MNVLITGGAGYIGAITNVFFRSRGYETVLFDNLKTGHRATIGDTKLVVGDLTIKKDIEEVFEKEKFDAVIHFAALALAGESMEKPYEYFSNNILGGLHLLEAMRKHGCHAIIFSSTCAVYGYPQKLPVTEAESFKPVSVYGSSKRMFEEILEWYGRIYGIQSVSLRYFNAAGALLDGSLGEAHEPESHIIPVALDVARGIQASFELFGDDYDTPDGTCIRDYIHVVDLAEAHVAALEYIFAGKPSTAVNVGVGRGYSNMEVLRMVEKVTGKAITRVVKERRPGDPSCIYADNTKAKELLHWGPRYSDLETIVASAWKWHQRESYKKRT